MDTAASRAANEAAPILASLLELPTFREHLKRWVCPLHGEAGAAVGWGGASGLVGGNDMVVSVVVFCVVAQKVVVREALSERGLRMVCLVIVGVVVDVWWCMCKVHASAWDLVNEID